MCHALPMKNDENKALMRAMQELRRSSASSKHRNKRKYRRTRKHKKTEEYRNA